MREYLEFLFACLLIPFVLGNQEDFETVVFTAAGTGQTSSSTYGTGLDPVLAYINVPVDVLYTDSGYVYIVESGGDCVRYYSTSQNILMNFAGVCSPSSTAYAGDDGDATAANLHLPSGITDDTKGNIYIADRLHDRIRVVDTTGIITTFAGNGRTLNNGDGGVASSASIADPVGVFFNNGKLYVCSFNYNQVRYIDASGIIYTLAGKSLSFSIYFIIFCFCRKFDFW